MPVRSVIPGWPGHALGVALLALLAGSSPATVLGAPQEAAPAPAGQAVVPEAAGPCLELRRRPTRWSGKGVCLPPGTRVAVTERVRGWVRVTPAEGEGGWVAAARLDFPAALGSPSVGPASPSPEAVAEGGSEDPPGGPAARPRVRVLPPIGARRPPPVAAETPAPVEAVAPLGQAADTAPPVPLEGADLAAVEAMVRAWARAWSEQRVDDYLGFYSAAFRPPGGKSRDAWRAERRRRLTAPRRIGVEVNSLGVRPVEPGRVSVRFTQRYESESYGDRVVKRLELLWEDGGWRILDERVEEQIDR